MPGLHKGQRPEHVHAVPVPTRTRPQTSDYRLIVAQTAQQLASDASGSWGCGAYYNSHWGQLCWDRQSEGLPIMVKELLPIILACTV